MLTPRAGINAALAFAAALAMGADPAAAAAGLGDVSSLPRRLGYVGIRDGVRVFDDCGNKHPVSLREGLLALRRHFPDARITAVLEPYGPFLATWGHRFARTLGLADSAVILPPAYRPGHPVGRPFDHEWMRAAGLDPVFAASHEDAAEIAMRQAAPGDLVAFFALPNASKVMARLAVDGRLA